MTRNVLDLKDLDGLLFRILLILLSRIILCMVCHVVDIYIYIYIYIDKIVLNKTKYLTLNSGAMGHKNTSI